MEKYILPFLDQHVRVPPKGTRIHKDECCFSFDTPTSEDGLYVDLMSFLGFNKHYVKLNYERSGHRLYLHIKQILKKKAEPEEARELEPPKKKPSVMGIGVEGGFDVDHRKGVEVEEKLAVVSLPTFDSFPYPNPAFPQKVQDSIAAILEANSSSTDDQVKEWVETRQVSIHSLELKQLDNGVKVSPKGWKCSKCDLTENLWMNLTDGTILCGRKNWDGTGGNGHALDHFKSTGFPLCVKLGTITAEGQADVFSYAEDEMVEDPHLAHHLAHFGIKIKEMEKTEKTVAELQIERNMKFDWSRIQEQDKELKPCYGPGYTGLRNLGNSCYMASVMQTLFAIPEVSKRYLEVPADKYFRDSPLDPTADFFTQMVKLGNGLWSGKHSFPVDEKDPLAPINGVAPRQLKSVVGKGHPEFSTSRQQDAMEFYQWILELIKRDEHRRSQGDKDVSKIFTYEVEERTECGTSHKVTYSRRLDNIVSLPIPLHKAINREEVKAFQEKQKAAEKEKKENEKDKKEEEPVRPIVPLLDCFEEFALPEEVNGFYSTAIKAKTNAIKTQRFGSFPDYLVLCMRRFTVGEDWLPKKLDVSIQVPDVLDLEKYRGKGLQVGEEELPKEGASQPAFVPSEEVMSVLTGMGFPHQRCVKAAYHTGNKNAEEAMNWLFSHMEDPDIDEPLKLPGQTQQKAEAEVDEESVAMIMSMGFTKEKAIKALQATQNNLERATDWIFSHGDDMDVVETQAPAPKSQVKDGSGKYVLKAFVSHMGNSTASGHYVCHILKDGKWILFNDNKVAESQDPPKDFGYLYFYQRS